MTTEPVKCPFCATAFDSPDSWCAHFLGVQADLTLDDYHDFISGEFPAKMLEDENGEAFYFMVRNENDIGTSALSEDGPKQ